MIRLLRHLCDIPIGIFDTIVYYTASAWQPIFEFMRALMLTLIVQVQRGRKEKAD